MPAHAAQPLIDLFGRLSPSAAKAASPLRKYSRLAIARKVNAFVRQLEGDDVAFAHTESLTYREGQRNLPFRRKLGLTPYVHVRNFALRLMSTCSRISDKRSAPLGEDDAVAVVLVEEIQTVDDPRVEAAADVLGNFLDDVPAVL